MGDWRVHFPVIGADYDSEGRPSLTPCKDLLHVRNSYDKLALVPYKQVGVHIPNLREIVDDEPDVGEYRVNYVTGRVYFNAAQEGQTFTASYDGIGTLVGVDEINWLWERVSENADFQYYTALKDTPYILVPRAVQVANKDANAITQMSPEIGRSYSDAILLYDWEGNFKFTGTVFDAVSLWKIGIGVQEPEIIDFSYGAIDNLSTDGSKLIGDENGGFLWSVTPLSSISKRGVSSITLGNHTGEIGILLSIERVYHRWDGTEWVVVGDKGKVENLDFSGWNTPEEINSVPYESLRPLADKNVSIAVKFGAGATLLPTITVLIRETQSFTRYDTKATFSIKESEWTVAIPDRDNWVVIVGSGRDDVVCGSEVIDFQDVNPNETVKVKAPVRTNVNVLLGGERIEDKVYFPPAERSWYSFFNDKTHPINQRTLPYAAFDGNLFTDHERDAVFSSLTTAQKNVAVAYDLKLGSYDNFLSALDYSGQYKKKNAFVPGNCGLAVPIGPSGYYLRMLPFAGVSLLNSTTPKAMGFLLRVWKTPVTIISAASTNNSIITFMVSGNTLYARNNYRYGGSPAQITNRKICNINANQWNSIVIHNHYQANPGCTHGQSTTAGWESIHLTVNGVDYAVNITVQPHACGARVTDYFPNTIGPDDGGSNVVYKNSGAAFVALPFALQANLSVAQAQEIGKKLLALGATNREPPASTARIVTEQLFMENMNVSDYATLSLPEGWSLMPHEPLFAFWDNKKLLTIRRNTKEVIEIPANCEYDDIRGTCADITTLRMNAELLATGYFANYQLMCISKDEGRYHQLYGAPGQLIASGTQIFNEYELANQNTARIQYADGEWRVTNLTKKVTDIRVAVLGGSILTSASNGNLGGGVGGETGGSWSLVENFVDLLDTPAHLLDNAPKTLVSYKGKVVKMPYIHPFLLRHI